MTTLNPKVDAFIQNSEKWQGEFEKLRMIALDCLLVEELKWGVPCYTFNKNNIVLMHGFKEYCALLFFKGVLLSDTQQILIQQTENVQAARQIRFRNLHEIVAVEASIKAYIFEAIEIEKAEIPLPIKKTIEYSIPEEFQQKLDEIKNLKASFEALTPGRQNAYIYFFSEPKQPKTRLARIEKNIARILSGKGLNDCVCGLSRKKPNCDGSHKVLD